MEIFKTAIPAEFEKYANDCLKGREGCVIHIGNTPCVWTGALRNTFNKEECVKRGLYIGQGQYLGGTIVCFPGDVSICHSSFQKEGFAEKLCSAVKEWFKSLGYALAFDENDFLLGGKKVFSWGRATAVSGITQTVAHFSVNLDISIVSAICTKPMIKTPGSLSVYGICSDDIINGIDFDNIVNG